MFRKRRRAIAMAFALAVSSMLGGCTSGATQTTSSESTQAAALGYADEMDKTKIMTVQISADEAEWQSMLDNAAAEEYISADITINGTKIKNVGIRPKGNSSLSSIARDDTTDRYSFKIKFDEYVKDQTWQGLDKLVLNNNFSDATSLKEYLSYDIMSYIGVDAPLYSFADISLNGKTWGLYLAVEDVDSSYLDRVEGGEGELYKPENEMGAGGRPDRAQDAVDAIASSPAAAAAGTGAVQNTEQKRPNLPNGGGMGGMSGMANNGVSLQYTDDEIGSYSAIFDNAKTKTDEADEQRVIEALKNLGEGKDLETYVDVDAVLRYFAAHTAVVNLDSYVSNMGHNYYLYENDGQISILPWDYNLAFGGFQSGSASDVANFPIDTPVSGVSLEERPLLAKLLEVPAYLATYHQYLQDIVDGYFTDGKFEQKVDTLSALIAEYVKNDPTAFYDDEAFEAGVTELKKLGALRAESIQGQLDGSIPSTTEGQKADSSALVDASSVNLKALGSQGGEGGRGGPGGQAGPNGQGFPGGQSDRSGPGAPPEMSGQNRGTDRAG